MEDLKANLALSEKNKIKKFILNMTLASIYYPVEPTEHGRMAHYVADKVVDWLKENRIVIGQDRNAKGGV